MRNLLVLLVVAQFVQAANFQPKRSLSDQQIKYIQSHQNQRSPSPRPPKSPQELIRKKSQDKIAHLQQQRQQAGN